MTTLVAATLVATHTHAAPPEHGVVPWRPSSIELALDELGKEMAALPSVARTATQLEAAAAVTTLEDLENLGTPIFGPPVDRRWTTREGMLYVGEASGSRFGLALRPDSTPANAPSVTAMPGGELLALLGRPCRDAMATLGRPSGLDREGLGWVWRWVHGDGRMLELGLACEDETRNVAAMALVWTIGPANLDMPDVRAGAKGGPWQALLRGPDTGKAKGRKVAESADLWPISFDWDVATLMAKLGKPPFASWIYRWGSSVSVGVGSDNRPRQITLDAGAGAYLRWRGLSGELADVVGEEPEMLVATLGPPAAKEAGQYTWAWQRDDGEMVELHATLSLVDDRTFVRELILQRTSGPQPDSCPEFAELKAPVATRPNVGPKVPMNMLSNGATAAPLVLPFGFSVATRREDVMRLLGLPSECVSSELAYPWLKVRFDDGGWLKGMDLEWAAAVRLRKRFPKDPVLALMAGPPEAATVAAGDRIFGPGVRTDEGRLYTYESGAHFATVKLAEEARRLQFERSSHPAQRAVDGLRWGRVVEEAQRLFGVTVAGAYDTDENAAVRLEAPHEDVYALMFTTAAIGQFGGKGPTGEVAQWLGAPWTEVVRKLGDPSEVTISDGKLTLQWNALAEDIFGRRLVMAFRGTMPLCERVTIVGRRMSVVGADPAANE